MTEHYQNLMTPKSQPGRHLLQLLLVPLMLALLIATSVHHEPALAAGEAVDRTATASPDGVVEINVVRGELRVVGWDRNEISVSGTLDEQTDEFVFDVGPDSSVISISLKDNSHSWCCDEGADLLVRVPHNSQVDISSVSTQLRVEKVAGGLDVGGVSGDINLADIAHRLNVTTVSGDIDLTKADGEIRLRTVSGDLDLEALDGDATLRTVSGETQVRDSRGNFDVGSVSGDVNISGTRVQVVRGNSVSGDVDLAVQFDEGDAMEVTTVSGSIRVKFDGEVNARFRLDARSGSIRNRLTDAQPQQSRHGNAESLVMVVGSGARDVRLQTRSGDIQIR